MGGTVSAFPKRESDIPLALGLQNAPAPLSDRRVSAFAMSESPVKSDFGVREGQHADVAGRQRPAVDRLASAMRARARSDPQGV